MVKPAAAPFSHLPVTRVTSMKKIDMVDDRLQAVTKSYKKTVSKRKGEKVKLQQTKKEEDASLNSMVRKLNHSSPTDTPGQWLLKTMLSNQHDVGSKVSLLQQTSQSLQQRRAHARQGERA